MRSFLTPEVPSPNGLLGFAKVRGCLLGSTSFLVDAGIQTCLGAKVETRACLGTRLGTQACLGGVVAWFADVSLIGVPFLIGTRLRQGAGMALTSKAIERRATEDDLC